MLKSTLPGSTGKSPTMPKFQKRVRMLLASWVPMRSAEIEPRWLAGTASVPARDAWTETTASRSTMVAIAVRFSRVMSQSS
jgi:hypothetical protein